MSFAPAGRTLPILAIEARFAAALDSGCTVVKAPTGTGKSTMVPIWCGRLGRVLVVEPRRLACRALASWIARLEETPLGHEVGYCVRDENRTSPQTRIVFATPGVVLRWIAEDRVDSFSTVVIDEFHERGLEVDLIYALLKQRGSRLVVMSATLDATRLAQHLGAELVEAHSPAFPVAVRYVAGEALQPELRGLEGRLEQALEIGRTAPGDMLVFLPGKAEIRKALGVVERAGLSGLELHGGLSLTQQARLFEPADERRVILATNVAETSLTLPGIGAVIDSGLVRRTRYFDGRSYLMVAPIALDSAEQRKGRAGRTGPGLCLRLWSQRAVLEPLTLPEIHRETLEQLALSAAACGASLDTAPLFDRPKPYAVEAAVDKCRSLGALDGQGRITDRGRRLFRLPLPASLAALLVEAERLGCLSDAVDLTAALSLGGPLFHDERPEDPQEDLRMGGCDAEALIRAVRAGIPRVHNLYPEALDEARRRRDELRRAFGLEPWPEKNAPLPDRRALLQAVLMADPSCGHVIRRRRSTVVLARGGGPELEIGRASALNDKKIEAAAVLATHLVGTSYNDRRIIATASMPARLAQLAAAGLGQEHLLAAFLEHGVVKAQIGRVLADQELEQRECIPEGELARAATVKLLLDRRLWRADVDTLRHRLTAARRWKSLVAMGLVDPSLEEGPWSTVEAVPELEEFLEARLVELGLETGADVVLLRGADILCPDLSPACRELLDHVYPQEWRCGDARYEIEYDLSQRTATLVQKSGDKRALNTAMLPPLRGLKVKLRQGSRVMVLR